MFRLLLSGVALAVAIILVSVFVRQPAADQAAGQAPGQEAAALPAEPVPPTRAPGEVAVELDEASVTSQVNTAIAGMGLTDMPMGSATVRDLTVQLRGGQIHVTGTAQIGPTALPLTLTGTAQAHSGRPRLTVADARISGVQMPQAARQSIEASLQSQLDSALAGQPLRVTSITIGSGKLTIIGARA